MRVYGDSVRSAAPMRDPNAFGRAHDRINGCCQTTSWLYAFYSAINVFVNVRFAIRHGDELEPAHPLRNDSLEGLFCPRSHSSAHR
jgi:hypothetical protein